MILNKSELISKLSNKFKSYTQSDIDYPVKKILDHISQSLYSGERIEMSFIIKVFKLSFNC